MKALLLPLLVFCFNAHANAQKWQKVADCEWPHRMYAISFSWNGKGYVAFGHNYNSAACFKDIETYDPVANSWTQDAYLDITGRTGAFSFRYNDLLFFGGGSSDSGMTARRDFYCYHLGDKSVISYLRTCDTLAPLPFGRAFGASAVLIDSMAYVVGGCVSDSCERAFWAYNVISKDWKELGALPMLGQFGCSFALNGKIYCGGGNDNSGLSTREFWSYDPRTGKWAMAKRLPGNSRTMGIGVACSNTEGIFGLGFDVNSFLNQQFMVSTMSRFSFYKDRVISSEDKYFLADLWKYNANTDTWKKVRRFPDPRRNACAFVTEGYLYIVTGNSANSKGSFRLKLTDEN